MSLSISSVSSRDGSGKRKTNSPYRGGDPKKVKKSEDASQTCNHRLQTILKIFREGGIRYTNSIEIDDRDRGCLEQAWVKSLKKGLSSATNTKEARSLLECIREMKNNTNNVYVQAIEIRDVVFTSEDGAQVVEKGVFARSDGPGIKKDQVVGVYSGKLVRVSGLTARKKEYLFEFPDTAFSQWGIDGREAGNYTRFINHCPPAKENVSSVEFIAELPYVVFVASKTILPGEQLMYDYGPEYWKKKGVTPN